MSAEFPFRMRNGIWDCEARSVEDRLSIINGMDRETLTAALAVPDLQLKVKSALRRRLKQFDEWGYDVTIAFNNGQPDQKFHYQGNARQVRRRAMLKSNAARVVELSEPMQFVKPCRSRKRWTRSGARRRSGARCFRASGRDVPVALRERAFFSSQVENIRFLQRGRDMIGDFLSGNKETLPDGQTC
jgi:hypothetical protein